MAPIINWYRGWVSTEQDTNGTATSRCQWTAPHFKHDMVPLDIQRRQRKATRQEALDAAYALVDTRDKGRCWVTGKQLQKSGVGSALLLTRHHLDERSTEPKRRHDVNNIVTVSLEAHRLITAGWIVVEGVDVRKRIGFHWSKEATVRPFRIRSRRRLEWKQAK